MEPSRQTTVLFADITGSTRLYETAGDSRAVEEIAVCMQMLRDAVEAHGGRVVKTMGDPIRSRRGGGTDADRCRIASSRRESQARAARRLSVGAGDPARKRRFRRHGQSRV